MLNWLQRIGGESGGLREIHTQFLQMLQDGRHIFDAATNCLLGGTDSSVIREDLFLTDQRINATEQLIRREIVVHGSIHGAATFPALLVMMSLVKDAERIGDYGKNIFGMAHEGAEIDDEKLHGELVVLKDQISTLLVRAHGLFDSRDDGRAHTFLEDTHTVERMCDERVGEMLKVTDRNMAAMVLAYRYFKRVASHTGNIVTSLVMPIDKLDYFPGKTSAEQ
ncbi:MAG: phosphate uptake regulator [Planctomycetota bacterium]|jgi:phosphate uptake regulator